MHEQLLSLLGEVSYVDKLDVVRRNAYISHEISHLSICGLIQVGENTVFELRVVDLSVIVTNLLINSNFEGSLVSKHILELRLVNWHSLLVGVIEFGAL